MTKQDFIRKISSRKFQAMLVGVLIPLFALVKIEEPTKGHLIAMITAVLACVGFMFAESQVDAARENGAQIRALLGNDMSVDQEEIAR